MSTPRFELTRIPFVNSLVKNRWPQFLVRAITLAGFLFTILTGLFGSAVGSHNFAIIFVWIAWWTALKLVFIPFGGRAWCAVCPIPMPGEWTQNRGILQPRGKKPFGLNKPWPKWLRGNWLQAFGFLLVGLFSAVILTTPQVTGYALLAILILAFGLSLVFEHRSFCEYLCPIGGFTGLYAQATPMEVRVKDKSVCLAHTEKDCYEACPWGQYPLALKSSANCGLCMECVRVCPKDNLGFNLRPYGTDLTADSKHNLSEAFLGLVMLGTALVDSAVFLGPWGSLKMAAYTIGSSQWLTFAAAYLPFTLVLVPGLFALAVGLSKKISGAGRTFKKALAYYGQVLVPLGLMAWIAFTVSFAFVKFGYVLPAISDPMGLGWNLLGLTGTAGVGQSSFFIQAIQVALLALGLFWTGRIALKISSSRREALPLVLFSSLFSVGILWLLIG